MDLRIRTHGTPGYRSVKRGESNGCHRLHNFEVLRLTGFFVRHHENMRDGLVPEDYVRKLDVQGPAGRPREREQGLPLRDHAAYPGHRPRRRRQGRRQGRQEHGAARRGSVARPPHQLVRTCHASCACCAGGRRVSRGVGIGPIRAYPSAHVQQRNDLASQSVGAPARLVPIRSAGGNGPARKRSVLDGVASGCERRQPHDGIPLGIRHQSRDRLSPSYRRLCRRRSADILAQ